MALSLEVFGELFDKLSSGRGPFPPPTGRRPKAPPRAPSRRPPPSGEGPRREPVPARRAAQDGPRRAAAAAPWPNTALLQNVLSFYDRFARENETNPRLQGEAARAYFKVGALYERLGRTGEAERPLARAMRCSTSWSRSAPTSPNIASGSSSWSSWPNPGRSPRAASNAWSASAQARSLIDGLIAESPEDLAYVQDLRCTSTRSSA